MTNKRLLKEYRALLKTPIENIYTQPLEDNILEWHYIIFAHSGDYKDGVYHGSLEFDKDYPMKPPKIKMFTPSGRFETDTRLCLSMSDYHPETWNPSWGVETILVGLYSFMLEDEFSEGTIGSIMDTSINRQVYARKSQEFNNSNKIFKEIFENYKNSKSEIKKDEQPDKEATCRYCFDSGRELVNPCVCDGSNKWVHIECLAKWQYSCILAQSTHPKYQTGIEKICNVCKTPFKITKYNRGDLMLNFTGEEIANMLEPGCYIVASLESSKRNMEIIDKQKDNKELIDNIMHWTESIFLIVRVVKYASAANELTTTDELMTSSEDNIMGISLTRNIELHKYPSLYFKWQTLSKYINTHIMDISHYIGGPCYSEDAYGLAIIKLDMLTGYDIDRLQSSIISTIHGDNMGVLFGPIVSIFYILRNYLSAFRVSKHKIPLRVIWGTAGWSRVQLLGEIAKGGWGMCRGDIADILPKNDNMWETVVKSSKPIYCGKNDFSST